MKFFDLVFKTRSYRRFNESHHIDSHILRQLIDLARLSASGANKQPLKYLIFNSPDSCERIFPSLSWAGYLSDWVGPEKGERPSGYIIILGDKTISDTFGVDHGIAAQSIMLGATEAGLGGCMISSVNRKGLRDELKVPDNFDILLVIALGKPVEKTIVEDVKNDDVKYYRDSEKNHHIPKRKLEDIIINQEQVK